MYYATHRPDEPPTPGVLFDSKATALKHRNPDQVISPVLTYDEQREWAEREQNRFDNDVYARVPWDHLEWDAESYRYIAEWYDTSTGETVSSKWAAEDTALRHRPGHVPRFPHMSLKFPGKIAFTKTEEHGVLDKQTVMRPGRYLELFFPTMPPEEREAWTQQVRAWGDQTLEMTTDEDQILDVYQKGPHSCMAHPPNQYASNPQHPVEAYANSDLALAYIQKTDGRYAARCLVWPEKKLYGRIYGDNALRHLLETHGYTRPDSVQGVFTGARLRAIPLEHGNGYLMPYVDWHECAELTTDERGVKWLTLRNHWPPRSEGREVFDCSTTAGITGDAWRCGRCEEVWVHGPEELCEGCLEECWRCGACDTRMHPGCEQYSLEDDTTDVLCYDCYVERRTLCAVCESAFRARIETWRGLTGEARRAATDLCSDCRDHHWWCTSCDAWIETDTTCSCSTEESHD